MREIARFYGYEANGRGYICCPLHGEKTPSMLLHKDSFKCFGCGAHGDAINFVSQLFHESALDAVKRLDRDFCLRLETGRAPDAAELKRRQQLAENKRRFEEWKDKFLSLLDAAIYVANKADYANPTDGQAVAIRYKEHFEYLSDILQHGELRERMSVFNDRKGAERLCRAILKCTTMPRTA